MIFCRGIGELKDFPASGGTVRCSGEFYKLPEFKTGRYPVRPVLASGARGRFTTSLGMGPDAAR